MLGEIVRFYWQLMLPDLIHAEYEFVEFILCGPFVLKIYHFRVFSWPNCQNIPKYLRRNKL